MAKLETKSETQYCNVCFAETKPGMWTCGNSYCQEASYYRCLANNCRRGKRAAELRTLANQKENKARAFSGPYAGPQWRREYSELT